MVQEKSPMDNANFMGLCQRLAPKSILESKKETINKLKI